MRTIPSAGVSTATVMLCALVATSQTSHAQPVTEDAPWTSNLRRTIDISTQQWRDLDYHNWAGQYVVGMDMHKIFSGERRDIGTLILQPYLVHIPGDHPRPAFFDGNETALTWRIANFNFNVLPRGRLNFRIGHFELPFGLEQDVNTNGTLRQYSNGENLGLKADWGVGVNGHFTRWQYEIGLTRGTGQEFHDTNDPYVFSARLGSPSNRPLVWGVAVLRGRIEGPGGLTARERIGFDGGWSSGPIGVMVEASAGRDAGLNARNWLTEINWTSPTDSMLIYLQRGRLSLASGAEVRERTGLGVRWMLNSRVTLATQLSRVRRQAALSPYDELRLHFRFRI